MKTADLNALLLEKIPAAFPGSDVSASKPVDGAPTCHYGFINVRLQAAETGTAIVERIKTLVKGPSIEKEGGNDERLEHATYKIGTAQEHCRMCISALGHRSAPEGFVILLIEQAREVNHPVIPLRMKKQ